MSGESAEQFSFEILQKSEGRLRRHKHEVLGSKFQHQCKKARCIGIYAISMLGSRDRRIPETGRQSFQVLRSRFSEIKIGGECWREMLALTLVSTHV